jgi:serine/threonine protein kinase
VDNCGHAHVADFGLATVTKNLDSMQSTACQRGYSVRWAAPEVLGEGAHSKEADVFSFAMVMIEVRYWRSTVRGLLLTVTSY